VEYIKEAEAENGFKRALMWALAVALQLPELIL
jgi:hypothetical protein